MAAEAQFGGKALSAYGAIQQGKMTADSLNRQADNLDAQAQEAHDKANYDAMRSQMFAAQKIGMSKAAFGASGVEANSGSVLDVIQASNQNAELDRLNILHGGDIRAINYMNQASMNRYGAESAKLGSYWSALGQLTGGAVQYAANKTAAKPSGEGAGLSPTGGNIDPSTTGAESGSAMAGIA